MYLLSNFCNLFDFSLIKISKFLINEFNAHFPNSQLEKLTDEISTSFRTETQYCVPPFV